MTSQIREYQIDADEVEISHLEGKRTIAIVMNASTFSQATDIDYFLTNVHQLSLQNG